MFQLVGRRGLQASLLELEPLVVQPVKRRGMEPNLLELVPLVFQLVGRRRLEPSLEVVFTTSKPIELIFNGNAYVVSNSLVTS